MVNINHILKRRNCPTLEHQLYDDIEEAMEFQEQEYGKFPPRDHLFFGSVNVPSKLKCAGIKNPCKYLSYRDFLWRVPSGTRTHDIQNHNQ